MEGIQFQLSIYLRTHYQSIYLSIEKSTNLPIYLLFDQTTKRPIDSSPLTQKNDIEKIIFINLKRTRNCQLGMPLANGYTKLGGSLSPPYPQQRRGYRLENITQQNRHITTAAPME
jgi:hypothetical protein